MDGYFFDIWIQGVLWDTDILCIVYFIFLFSCINKGWPFLFIHPTIHQWYLQLPFVHRQTEPPYTQNHESLDLRKMMMIARNTVHWQLQSKNVVSSISAKTNHQNYPFKIFIKAVLKIEHKTYLCGHLFSKSCICCSLFHTHGNTPPLCSLCCITVVSLRELLRQAESVEDIFSLLKRIG